jgi:hypothetical protein
MNALIAIILGLIVFVIAALTQFFSGSIRDAFLILGIVSIAGGLSTRLMTKLIK